MGRESLGGEPVKLESPSSAEDREAQRRTKALERLTADGILEAGDDERLPPPRLERLIANELQRRDCKVRWLIEHQFVDDFEVADMSEEEIDQLLAEDFEPNFWQDYFHPEQIRKREPGQRDEQDMRTIFGRTAEREGMDDLFEIVPAPAAQDQGLDKIDFSLRLKNPDGSYDDLPVQVTSDTDPDRLRVKAHQLHGKRTLFAHLPARLHELVELKNPRNDRLASIQFLAQILEGLHAKRIKIPAYGDAADRIMDTLLALRKAA